MQIRMVIEYDTATNHLKLTSPKDPVVCYGILERAKDLIREAARKNQDAAIIPAKFIPGDGM